MTGYRGGLSTDRGEDWRYRAACRGRAPLFDETIDGDGAGRESLPARLERHRRALAVCAHCPVVAECGADADAARAQGVIQAGLIRGERHPADVDADVTAEVQRLVGEGRSDVYIAAALHLDRKTVRSRRRMLGLEPVRRREQVAS